MSPWRIASPTGSTAPPRPGTSGPHRPRSSTRPPAMQTGEVDLASAAEVDGRRGQRQGRRRASGARRRCRAAPAVLFAFRELLHDARRRARRDHHRRARQGALRRRTARSPAALENVEFAVRRPAADQGRLQRAGRAPASTSTRSASRSASSPASRRSTSRPWCRCGCAPTRSPAATRSCSSPARRTRRPSLWLAETVAAGRPARRRVHRACRATRRRSTRCSTHPDIAAVSFVGSTPIARYIYETRHRARQAGAGPRRGEEPHGGAARRRHRPGRRRRGLGRLRRGRRALHGDLGGGRRRRRRRPAGRRDRRPAAQAAHRRRRRRRHRHGPADHRRAPRQGGRLHRRRRRVRGARSSSTAARPTSRPTGFFLGTTLLDHVTPRDERLHRRDLRPGAVGRARRHLRRGARR